MKKGIMRPGHVQIRVLDMEAALKHYVDLLGLIETDRDESGRVYLKAWSEVDKFSSALETSKNYIQQTSPNSDLSYSSSLQTSIDLYGYDINKIDDKLRINLTNYLSNQSGENNKMELVQTPKGFRSLEIYRYKKDISMLITTYSNNAFG